MNPLTHIRREVLFAAFAALLLAGLLGKAPLALAERPNVVVIQTDDQNPNLMKSSFRGKNGAVRKTMPNTLADIVRSGTEFRNYYVTTPLCSPSRASLLNGQYSHNNGLETNDGKFGGWKGWRSLPIYEENLPVTLQEAGYRTSHFGKFTNSYYNSFTGGVAANVPPGWNRWFTTSFRSRDSRFYGYLMSNNGAKAGPFGDPKYKSTGETIDPRSCTARTERVRVDRNPEERGKTSARKGKSRTVRCNHMTDVLTRKAVKEIRDHHKKPFYMQVDYEAPHGDVRPPNGPQPATRHIGSAARTKIPRSPNFNERNFSDKPKLTRSNARRRLTRKEVRDLTGSYQRQLESLRSVDDGVGEIIRTLRRTGELDNTYIFFLSDHGYFLGEHRFALAKFLPYEESSTVSMAVRGPGVARGKSDEVVGNIDVPATVVRLADADPSYQLDGRSLGRFWRDPDRTSRRPIEISLPNPFRPRDDDLLSGEASVSAKAPALRYTGFRVGPYKLIRYWNGELELYDLERDPYELRNRYADPAYRKVGKYMLEHLAGVVGCVGPECRAELPPWPEPDLP